MPSANLGDTSRTTTVEAVDEGDQGVCEERENIGPSSHFQAMQLQPPQILLDNPSNDSCWDSDSSELLNSSNMSGVEFTDPSQIEENRPRQTPLSLPILFLHEDRGTSDLSDLSDLTSLSDFGEEDETAILLESRRAAARRIHGHRLDAERSSNYCSPEAIPDSQYLLMIKPNSKQEGFIPRLPLSTEVFAVKDLREKYNQSNARQSACGSPASYSPLEDQSFIEFHLSEFSIYLPNNKYHPFAMRGLQHLGVKVGNAKLLLDGVLSFGYTRHYVQNLPFKLRSIGNYGEDLHEVGSQIWIESELNLGTNIFYRLGKPSAEYKRYHDEFLWLADFAKHFVDFCQASENPITLQNFRTDFYQWLKRTHSTSPAFRSWFKKYNKHDFRSAVSVNINFLFLESMGINQDLRSHPIWSEVMSRDIVLFQKIQEEETIVTQYIYECFKDIRFGHHLKVLPSPLGQPSQGYPVMKPAGSICMDSQHMTLEKVQSGEEPTLSQPEEEITITNSVERRSMMKDIKVGNVLSVTKDDCQSVWKDEISRWKTADDCWYVYVQEVHHLDNDESEYDAIWLYKPSDTSCAKMKYPYPEELFLSDNCTCSKSRIAADEVLDVVSVRWHGQPSATESSHFIRQTYLQNEIFVTLEEEHKTCEHLRAQQDTVPSKPLPRYPVGSTVLVPPRSNSTHGLEPYEIDDYITEGLKQFAVLRRLRRKLEIDNTGGKNELVYTDEMEKVAVHKIQRTCLVRFYTEFDVSHNALPAPYNRNGNGNAFYITTRLVETSRKKFLKPISCENPEDLLNGLDLFCGGGNFGRGLEEGGALRNRWAVDIDKNAIHTYNANVDESEPTKLFYGSVNDMLAQAMRGNPMNSDLIPLPGDVDFISAGSPCQGFSSLNNQPNNDKGLKNQSLVASVAAYVDFYRPKYGVLENVLSMAQRGRGRDEDVMSQLICAIVGLGYQVRLCVLDAWSCEFGARRIGPTPFEWVTIEESIADLPAIGDGATYQCIPHPDHVMAGSLTEQLRGRIKAIPTHPQGMNFYKTWDDGQGLMSLEERSRFPPLYKKDGTMRSMHKPFSKAYARVQSKAIFPCMTVTLSPSDAIMGSAIHWDDNRIFTAMEGRRIQGVPDHEVFLGTSSEVWKILGNSVNRNVSLALGLSLRDAWLANDPEIYRKPVGAESASTLPAFSKSREVILARRPQTTSKSRTIRRSTERGVLVRIPVPAPPLPSGNSSDDESDLTRWTSNFMMSLVPKSCTLPDQRQDTTINSAEASRKSKGGVCLKRPHMALQETSMLPKEKSSKFASASSHMSPTGQTTRTTDSGKVLLQRAENEEFLATKLKQVARQSLRQIDHDYLPADDENEGYREDSGENNESEITTASVSPRSSTRPRGGPTRSRWERPSRRRHHTPVVISLVSDDEDGDIGFRQERQVRRTWAEPFRRNRPRASMSVTSQLTHPKNYRGYGLGSQRHYLPASRPCQPRHTPSWPAPDIAAQIRHPPMYPNNSSNTPHLSRPSHGPRPSNLPSLPNHQAEREAEEQQNALRAAQHKQDIRQVERREKANREAEKQDAQTREAERKRREMEVLAPKQKLVGIWVREVGERDRQMYRRDTGVPPICAAAREDGFG
ncbi:hypothetical protein BKA65DRAFT_471005 [Rhexocercosporidium sp. MPI-PUGE-AT-0058]|nr:hypothetical protein BKA65DRAFT_471005 [Rhexocercosporidium sp. MPI-PUGE-AT-0058]